MRSIALFSSLWKRSAQNLMSPFHRSPTPSFLQWPQSCQPPSQASTSPQSRRYTPRITHLNKVADLKPTIPAPLLSSLSASQLRGVEFGAARHGRVLICDETGMGKKMQALAVAAIYKEDWPLLILAARVLVPCWEDEIKKWLPGCEIETTGARWNSQVCILAYDFQKPVRVELEKHTFRAAIVDDAHLLRSSGGQRRKCLTACLSKCRRLIMLSGSPSLCASPESIRPLARLVRPDIFSFVFDYQSRYRSHGALGGTDFAEEFQAVLASVLLIRRARADELPHGRRCLVRLAGEMQPGDDSAADWRQTGIAKSKAAIAFISNLLLKEAKVVVYAQHDEVMAAIEAGAKAAGYNHIRIDQNTPYTRRYDLQQKFQLESQCRLAICSFAAAVGCSFSGCAPAAAVLAELHSDPRVALRAEERLGKSPGVLVYWLHLVGTIDDRLLKLGTAAVREPEEADQHPREEPPHTPKEQSNPIKQQRPAHLGGFQFVSKRKEPTAGKSKVSPTKEAAAATGNPMFVTLDEAEQEELMELICSDSELDEDDTPDAGKQGQKATPTHRLQPPRKTLVVSNGHSPH